MKVDRDSCMLQFPEQESYSDEKSGRSRLNVERKRGGGGERVKGPQDRNGGRRRVPTLAPRALRPSNAKRGEPKLTRRSQPLPFQHADSSSQEALGCPSLEMDAFLDDPYADQDDFARASSSYRPPNRPPTDSSRRQAHLNDAADEEDAQVESDRQEEDAEVTERDRDRFYAVLNIDREASEDQVREAYRALAVALHPDKHLEETAKQAAQSRFREVQRAYEVLSDREKRTVYDYFGEEGLNSTWTISTRGRSPEELRREFERQQATKQAKEAEDLIKSRGEFTAQIDAAALFVPSNRVPRPPPRAGQPVTLQDRWNRVGCSQLVGKHGFELPVTSKTSVNLAGQMVSRSGGIGGGNLIGTVKTHWSPRLFTEMSATLMRPRVASIKGQFTIDQFSFINFAATSTTLAVPPAFNISYGQRLSNESALTGFTAFRSGAYTLGPWGKSVAEAGALAMDPPSVTVGLTSSDNAGAGWTAQTSIGLADLSINVDRGIVAKWLGGAKLKAGISLGSASGVSVFANGDRSVSESTNVGFGVTAGLPGGVSVRLRFSRLGQKVTVPILLSPIPRSDLVVAAVGVPLAGLFVLETFYLSPKKRRKVRGRLQELRRDNWEWIKERRQAAQEGVSVLRSQARKKAASERHRGGLVILEAFYGREDRLPQTTAKFANCVDPEHLDREAWKSEGEVSDQENRPEVSDEYLGSPGAAFSEAEFASLELFCDVKVPLQALVNKSKLVIPGGRGKANLLGFYDPAMGEKKVLRVRYLFRGQIHDATFADKDAVAAPMRSHQL
ncbi:unnamed protein product [Parajaminaea phylloscopi]